jgi:hypothetical protein
MSGMLGMAEEQIKFNAYSVTTEAFTWARLCYSRYVVKSLNCQFGGCSCFIFHALLVIFLRRTAVLSSE